MGGKCKCGAHSMVETVWGQRAAEDQSTVGYGDESHHSAPAENPDPFLPIFNDFQEKMEIWIFM